MIKTIKVIRLSPSTDLGPWSAIAHENVVSGRAQERAHEVFNAARQGMQTIRVGIWEAAPYCENLVDYPCDEFMYVLEGACTITDANGNVEHFTQGESFFMPRGFNGTWEQKTSMKKYFMISEAVTS